LFYEDNFSENVSKIVYIIGRGASRYLPIKTFNRMEVSFAVERSKVATILAAQILVSSPCFAKKVRDFVVKVKQIEDKAESN
jgi:hypothetical protein